MRQRRRVAAWCVLVAASVTACKSDKSQPAASSGASPDQDAPSQAEPMRVEEEVGTGAEEVSRRAVEGAEPEPLGHVVVDSSNPAYTMVVGVPRSASESVREDLERRAQESGAAWLTWREFRRDLPRHLHTRVTGEDAASKVERFLSLVQENPLQPLALTFEGGVAVTASDYRAAEARYRRRAK